MRDPARIPVILERLRVVWEKSPDMRLGQLVSIGLHWSEWGSDPFYIEDEFLMEGIEFGMKR